MKRVIPMYKIPFRRLSQFREKFVNESVKYNFTSWFPGHMYKGILQMQAKLAVVDCIIEVHDARVPFSGRNPKFTSMLTSIKPHILVLNKSDLANLTQKNVIIERLQKENTQNIIFTQCKSSRKSGISVIIPTIQELIENSEVNSKRNASSFNVMIIGIPNVGKSSLINRLRNHNLKGKNATTVGAVPGITKSVLEKIKISDHPLIYLLDTPGVMAPNITDVEVGLKLALCWTLKDDLIGEEVMADYLLYWLNKHKNFNYVGYLGLKEPIDDVRLLLIHVAKHFNKIMTVKSAEGSLIQVPNLQACALHFIKGFRTGLYGKVLLDCDLL